MISRIGTHERVLRKSKTISWFGYVSRHATLENTILQDHVEGIRKIGGLKRKWMYDV